MTESELFVRDVAALLLDEETDSEGREFVWENDDAWATLHSLIVLARAIELRGRGA